MLPLQHGRPPELVVERAVILRHRERRQRQRDVERTGTGLELGQGADEGQALGQLLGGDEPRVPTVVPCGAPHRRPRVAADPDGRVRLLDGLRREGDAVEVDVGAVVLRFVAGPELDHRREVLVGHATALVERGPEHLELALRVPDADRDADPASGEEVERRDRLREHHGVVVGHHDHRRVDDEARGGTGDEGHRGQGVRPERSHQLDHVGGDDDVLRDRDGVEAELVGGAGHPLEVLRAE
ncbi:MAG TPA: hypothetical protein VIA11_08935 [Acidimicrobiia bacterium]|nr:hypothetical protein [Acidimicrobiia bacterium]